MSSQDCCLRKLSAEGGVTLSLKSELKFQLSQDSVYFGRVGSIVDILIVNLIGILEWSDVSSTLHGSLGLNY